MKDLPVLQDGPPAGGFPSIRFARRLPSTGPTGFTLFSVTTAIMAYGFYKVGGHTTLKTCACLPLANSMQSSYLAVVGVHWHQQMPAASPKLVTRGGH